MNKQEIIDAIEMLRTDMENFHKLLAEQPNSPVKQMIKKQIKAYETAISALEKQIPKKPIEEEKQYSEDYGFNSDILCPVCNNYIGYYTEAMCKPEYMQYCNECGQRIDDDWSGEDE